MYLGMKIKGKRSSDPWQIIGLQMGEGARTAIECTQVDESRKPNVMPPHGDCPDAWNVATGWRTLGAWRQSYPLAWNALILFSEHPWLNLKLTDWLVQWD